MIWLTGFHFLGFEIFIGLVIYSMPVVLLVILVSILFLIWDWVMTYILKNL